MQGSFLSSVIEFGRVVSEEFFLKKSSNGLFCFCCSILMPCCIFVGGPQRELPVMFHWLSCFRDVL